MLSSSLSRAYYAESIDHVNHPADALGDVARTNALLAIGNAARQADLALMHDDFDVARVNVAVVGEPGADVLVDAVVPSLPTLGSLTPGDALSEIDALRPAMKRGVALVDRGLPG